LVDLREFHQEDDETDVEAEEEDKEEDEDEASGWSRFGATKRTSSGSLTTMGVSGRVVFESDCLDFRKKEVKNDDRAFD
jgi:hypothetical protein